MKHPDDTDCAGERCAWRNDGGHHVTVTADPDDGHTPDQSGLWLTLWNETCAHLHEKDLGHNGGYCVICRRAGLDVPRYHINGRAIVPLHVICDGLGVAMENLVGLWSLEVGHPDLTEWPEGLRNTVLSIYAHNACNADPALLATLDPKEARA